VLLYHLVFPTKFRRIVIDEKVDQIIRDTCDGIALRYDIHFVEIGTDKDHIHFLIQSIPIWNVTRIVTAREVFKQIPKLKKKMWGASLWTSGYYASTVGKNGSETAIGRYVKEQGNEKDYRQIQKNQLKLFT